MKGRFFFFFSFSHHFLRFAEFSAPEHQHELYNVSNVFEREEPRKEKEDTESMEGKR